MSRFDELKDKLRPADLHWQCDDFHCAAHKSWKEGWDSCAAEYEKLIAEKYELHRMQLVAISTACQHNTDETKKLRIEKQSPYWTPSYQDVCETVDTEIELRQKLAKTVEAIK